MLKNFKLTILAIASFLTGCATIVEKASIDILEDLSSHGQVIISSSYSEIDSKENQAKSITDKAQACGATTKVSGSKEKARLFIQANASVKSRDELDALLQCGAFGHAEPKISIAASDGILWKEYQVNFQMRSNAFQLFGDSFPREIGISVPGEIESITDDSVTMNYKRTIKKEGSNRLSITITPKELSKKEQAELKAKICPKSTKDCSISEKDFNALPDEVKYATLRLSIKSKKPKYDIQTIFSILGLLFGSGVIIQVLGKISKTKQPPMTTS